jgi:CheY-like chemotaxis protein
VSCALLVDDEPAILRLLAAVMDEMGVATVQAADAETALARLEEADPDVVIADIRLPGMDGVELARRIKADYRYSLVPVILISAYEPPNLRNSGADAFIRKPFDIDALADTVAQKLRGGETGS